MPFIWAVLEPSGNWSHYLHSPSGITHVVHGADGKNDLNVEDYQVARITRLGFNKLQLTECYTHRLGWKAEAGAIGHDGTYVYDR